MREKAEVSRKQREDKISKMERIREIERQKMLKDARRRERGYQRMHEESVKRAQNYHAFKKAKIDTHRKGKLVESSARTKRKRAERRRDARMANLGKPVASFPSDPGSASRATSSRREKDVQPAIHLALDDRGTRLARFLQSGKDGFRPGMESDQDRQTRLTLEDENFHLKAEFRRLDAEKAARWKELVRTDQWATHESDPLIIVLDEEI